MLLHCSVAREVWWAALNFIRMPQRFQVDTLDICDSWNRLRVGLPKKQKRGMDTLFILVCWHLWKERNARVFGSQTSSAQELIRIIKEEAHWWIQAGAKNLGSLVTRE